MKRIKLINKLNLNKTTISELNNGQTEKIIGGAKRSDRIACDLSIIICETIAGCGTVTVCETFNRKCFSAVDRCPTGRGCL